jgi:DNA polymerase
MKVVDLDIETYSEADLTKVGVYSYADDPSTEVLILCYAIDDGPVRRWTCGQPMPAALRAAAEDPEFLWYAHNAEFERVVIAGTLVKRHGWPAVPLRRWRCTAVMAAAAGLPRGLAAAAEVNGQPQQKNPEGKKLMRMFSFPRKPTKKDPRTRILPSEEPEAFKRYVVYCVDDVEAARQLRKSLPPLRDADWTSYHMTMHMNGIGMPLDVPLLHAAKAVAVELEARIAARSAEITGGLRPTQRDKLIAWLEENGAVTEDIKKDSVDRLLEGNINLPPETRELLELRVEGSRAATKKIDSMLASVQADGRVRGTILHNGAHTGRDAGRLIQPQNFKRGIGDPRAISNTLDLLRFGDADLFAAMYDKPMEQISNVVRGFIRASEGNELLVVDYAQIEARLVDWHAGNDRGLAEWASGADKYKLMATHIYQKLLEEITKEERRIGKNSVLGAGFGMSAAAFLVYCHNVGATDVDEELAELAIGTYRQVNAPVVEYWSDVERYAKAAIEHPKQEFTLRYCSFAMHRHWLTITLPSGRRLMYPHAKLHKETGRYGRPRTSITFTSARGINSTYGAKLVENIVQATSYDVLVNGQRNAIRAKYLPCLRVHDEGVFEQERGTRSIHELEKLMCDVPTWAKGCPITAEGFTTVFYRKG